MSSASTVVEATSEDHAAYEDEVLRYNIKMLLAATPGVNQTTLARVFNITTAGMSYKLNRPGRLSFKDVILIADELGTSVQALMDDSVYRRMNDWTLKNRKGAELGDDDRMGDGRARYFLMPESSECPGCDSNVTFLQVNIKFFSFSDNVLQYGFIIRKSAHN